MIQRDYECTRIAQVQKLQNSRLAFRKAVPHGYTRVAPAIHASNDETVAPLTLKSTRRRRYKCTCRSVRKKMLNEGEKMIIVGKPSPLTIVASLISITGTGCVSPLVTRLEAFHEAKKRGDYERAATFLADDARVWFEKKDGAGKPYTVEGGPYKAWDRVFNATSKRGRMRVEGNRVRYRSVENNDYYRLIDRPLSTGRITYYFNEDELISGMLYEPLSTRANRPPDRRCEFDRWASERYPGLLDSPEMRIPGNPERWRALLVEWREDVGLPPITPRHDHE